MANQVKQGQEHRPTGTSGRQSGDTNPGTSGDNDDDRRNEPPPKRNRVNRDDDEDSGLGNRTTNR